MNVRNFTISFADGRALCLVLSYYLPALLPPEDILAPPEAVTAPSPEVCYPLEANEGAFTSKQN